MIPRNDIPTEALLLLFSWTHVHRINLEFGMEAFGA